MQSFLEIRQHHPDANIYMMTGYSVEQLLCQAAQNGALGVITKPIDPRTIEAPNVENQAITQSRAFGVAIFKDGRIALKDFVGVYDVNKEGAGPFFGYSTYTFDDGSSVTARFTGENKPNQAAHGDYKILSGTGAYAGATGTGTFDRVPSQFKNVRIFNVKLKIATP